MARKSLKRLTVKEPIRLLEISKAIAVIVQKTAVSSEAISPWCAI